jgi:YD repeat-containing protein
MNHGSRPFVGTRGGRTPSCFFSRNFNRSLLALRLLCLVLCANLVVWPITSLAKRSMTTTKAQAPALPTPGVPGLNLPNLPNARAKLPPALAAQWSNVKSVLDNIGPSDGGVAVTSLIPALGAAPGTAMYCDYCDPCPDCGDPCPECVEPNQPPAANAGGPYEGTAGVAIQFNGTASYDPDGTIVRYDWSFGDGASATGATPAHSYGSAGTYTVSLTVTDNSGATDMHTTTATVSTAPPPPPPPAVSNGSRYLSQSVPSTMIGGRSYDVAVAMSNSGTSTWSAVNNYRLGSQNPQDNSTWGLGRVTLPSTVAPSEQVTFNFTVVAPSTPGTYNFRWRMVQDGVEWFGDYTPNVAVTVSLPPTGGGPSPSTNALSAQLEPRNRTGQPGEDLLSGNYNWSLPLLSLAGRAGFDLNLSLTYNSLVWTKYQSSIQYDVDRGFPGPGFRIGLPVIQQRFLNEATGSYAYLLITPSGAHAELRQVGTSGIYEAADSSYLQLTESAPYLLLKTTDGTQFWFIPAANGQYQPQQIEDRNGNSIWINWDGYGNPSSIIDTLGRTINFNYDINNLLQSISETWNGQEHPWATFLYSSIFMQTNFSGLTVMGPNNSNQIVLTQVSLHDGSRYAFTYTSWGQVYQIEHYAADGHRLNYVAYDLPQNSGVAQDDCPRFTQRKDYAENWNNGLEAISTFNFDPNGAFGQVTLPDNSTVYKELFATSGWQKGLTVQTESWSGGVRQKWTTADWTQDNGSVELGRHRLFDLNSYVECSRPSNVGAAVFRNGPKRNLSRYDYGLRRLWPLTIEARSRAERRNSDRLRI